VNSVLNSDSQPFLHNGSLKFRNDLYGPLKGLKNLLTNK
jgi:hypothetical protein